MSYRFGFTAALIAFGSPAAAQIPADQRGMTASTRELLGDGTTEAPPARAPGRRTPLAGPFSGAAAEKAQASFEISAAGGRMLLRVRGDFTGEHASGVQVALSPSARMPARGAVVVGTLQRRAGPQSFEIPGRVDLSAFSHVVLWCELCAGAIGSAPLDQE